MYSTNDAFNANLALSNIGLVLHRKSSTLIRPHMNKAKFEPIRNRVRNGVSFWKPKDFQNIFYCCSFNSTISMIHISFYAALKIKTKNLLKWLWWNYTIPVWPQFAFVKQKVNCAVW